MTKRNKRIRARGFMYTQFLDYMPNEVTVQTLSDLVKNLDNLKRYAWIIHDKDVDYDGNLVKPHIHLMLEFINARSVRGVAKILGDKEQYVEIWNKKIDNGFAYLIHATENSKDSHQYNPTEVTSNFDYVDYIEKQSQRIATQKRNNLSNKIDKYLDLVAIGEITLKETKMLLSGSEYARAYRRLDAAHALYLERRAEEFYQEMQETGDLVKVHWLYGPGGSGKTHLAITLANAHGKYYFTSAKKDPFQFYQSQPILVLDEFRPDAITYSELLRMCDPRSGGKVTMSSRYQNKRLSCREIFITTPYDPVLFYKKMHVDSDDTGYQLFRRLTTVMRFEQDYIYDQKYDMDSGQYVDIGKKRNMFSEVSNENNEEYESLFYEIEGEDFFQSEEHMLLQTGFEDKIDIPF